MQQTSKLQKYSTKTLVDPATGEVINAHQILMQEGDFNFHKIWWENFMETTKEIGTKKIAVMMWLIFSAEKGTNRVSLTQEEIAKGCGTSLRTVSSAISELKKGGFLKLTEKYILLNPNVIFRGTYEKRIAVMEEWQALQDKEDCKND